MKSWNVDSDQTKLSYIALSLSTFSSIFDVMTRKQNWFLNNTPRIYLVISHFLNFFFFLIKPATIRERKHNNSKSGIMRTLPTAETTEFWGHHKVTKRKRQVHLLNDIMPCISASLLRRIWPWNLLGSGWESKVLSDYVRGTSNWHVRRSKSWGNRWRLRRSRQTKNYFSFIYVLSYMCSYLGLFN